MIIDTADDMGARSDALVPSQSAVAKYVQARIDEVSVSGGGGIGASGAGGFSPSQGFLSAMLLLHGG